MTKVIGIRFRNAGKVYYFDPGDLDLKHGDMAVVETASGPECGHVVLQAREVPDEKVVKPLRPVIRKADDKDIAREAELREKEKDAYHICRKKIKEHNLDMKLVQAEYAFDGKKIVFYFTADGRVDFRELIRDLASVFHNRIELRQIGVRDETRILGGIGICGRQLCCSTYLTDFAPVSIRMAKEQNLSLNPGKISGVCGRLMCCLKNEEETYEYLNKNLPGVGDTVQTPDERTGTVSAVNVLRQRIRVLIEEGDEKDMEEYPAEELTLIAKKKKGQKQQPKKKAEAKENNSAAAATEENGKEGGGKEGSSKQGKPKRERNRRRKPSSAHQEGQRMNGENASLREEGKAPAEGRREPAEKTEAAADNGAPQDAGAPEGVKKHRRNRHRRHRNGGARGDQNAGNSET
ncbi:MAG: stage 0 sporulation family protein [Eubacteriales bacterium]|jgi:cell fate regulator YaaT (PSP1 superfamily)